MSDLVGAEQPSESLDAARTHNGIEVARDVMGALGAVSLSLTTEAGSYAPYLAFGGGGALAVAAVLHRWVKS